jgi:hypothetical protein
MHDLLVLLTTMQHNKRSPTLVSTPGSAVDSRPRASCRASPSRPSAPLPRGACGRAALSTAGITLSSTTRGASLGAALSGCLENYKPDSGARVAY